MRSSTRSSPFFWRRTLLPIGALALAACAGPESRSTADSRADAMAVDTVYLDEVMRLGADTSEAFGSVRAIAVNAAGLLWVLDGPTREIRVFGENGALVRRVGRSGAGPGEFAQPAALVASSTGHVWIDDPGNARIVAMDTAGRVVGNHAVARGCMQARPWPAAVDAANRYVSVGGADCDLVVRWDSAFRELERAAAPRDARPPQDIETPSGSASIPFAGEVLWHPAADTTIWALRTDDYRITRLTFRGDTVRSAEVPFERARLSEADRAPADEFFAELAREGVVVDRSVLPRDKPATVSFFRGERRESVGRLAGDAVGSGASAAVRGARSTRGLPRRASGGTFGN